MCSARASSDLGVAPWNHSEKNLCKRTISLSMAACTSSIDTSALGVHRFQEIVFLALKREAAGKSRCESSLETRAQGISFCCAMDDQSYVRRYLHRDPEIVIPRNDGKGVYRLCLPLFSAQ